MSDVAVNGFQGAPQVRRWDRHAINSVLKPAFAALGLVAAVSFFVGALHALPTAPAAPAAETPAPLPAWRWIMRPVQIYSLQAPEFAGAPTTYKARVHTPGGGREDSITFGEFAGAKPALALRMFRRGTEAPTSEPFEAALTREAERLGLAVFGAGQAERVTTRIGQFEVGEFSVAAPGGGTRPCSGLRLALEQPALSVTGLACGSRALSPAQVGCLLERLDVSSARDDRELIEFFAASELKRNAACKGMRLGPDGLHAAWLDEKTTPANVANVKRAGKGATARRSLRRH